jgi:hypothetical protein
MAKFDPTQFDCSDSGNLARWEEVKALFTSAETFVYKFSTGNQSSGLTARKQLRQLSKHCALLLRTIQIRSIERNAERKVERATKKAMKLAIKSDAALDEVSENLIQPDEPSVDETEQA